MFCFLILRMIQGTVINYTQQESNAFMQLTMQLPVFRDSTMAASSDSPHQERARPRRLVPVDLPGHHGAQTTDRDRRRKRR